MRPEDNKAVVSRYLLQGLGELDPTVVDEVFAPDHALSSPELGTEPETGTQALKDVIEGFRRDSHDLTCTVENQIAEGDWVATSYTLSEAEVHRGIMLSRVVDVRIQESHVVAQTVSESQAQALAAQDKVTTLRRAFN